MKRRDYIACAVLAAMTAVVAFVPPAETVAYDTGKAYRAKVLLTDDSDVVETLSLKYGSEKLEVELLEGPLAGARMRASNELRAQADLDKTFSPGDIALVDWPEGDVTASSVLVARDHWRLGWMWVMVALFAALLAAFAGWTGVKALFSFAFSCFVVWKFLVPMCLKGYCASLVSLATVSLLTFVIMYLVAGPTKKGVAAFAGSVLGVVASLALARIFSVLMHVDGMTMPFVQALANAGLESLDTADIFTGAVILASSGAVMDLAMDIAAGIDEVKRHNPSLGFRELLLSGVRIGRAVVGTMTTTLLLAYSGGYLTLLMVFAAQGTPPLVFLNSTIVSAEVVKTFVGSFGLVLVAPFTALAGAWIYTRQK